MKKFLVISLSIVIIGIGLYFIDYLLLLPDIETKEYSYTTATSGYNLFNYDDNFNTYSIKNDNIDIKVNDVKINLINNNLYIDSIDIEDVKSMYHYFSVYNENTLILGYTDTSDNNVILIYDIEKKDYKEIKSIDKFNITFEEDIIFEKDDILVTVTNIKDNKLINSNKDICSLDDDYIVKKIYLIHFKNNKLNIDNREVLYTSSMLSYKYEKGICE